MRLSNTSAFRFFFITFLVLNSFNSIAEETSLIEGFWLTSASIVEATEMKAEIGLDFPILDN